jgi:hypothetical protein
MAFPARLFWQKDIFGAEMHFLIHFLSFPWITAEKRRGNTEMTRKVENWVEKVDKRVTRDNTRSCPKIPRKSG